MIAVLRVAVCVLANIADALAAGIRGGCASVVKGALFNRLVQAIAHSASRKRPCSANHSHYSLDGGQGLKLCLPDAPSAAGPQRARRTKRPTVRMTIHARAHDPLVSGGHVALERRGLERRMHRSLGAHQPLNDGSETTEVSMNNFFTPVFRLTRHCPLPCIPLRAINLPIESRKVFPTQPLASGPKLDPGTDPSSPGRLS
jgi:hypothetical protein